MNPERYNDAIELLKAARDYPEATTPIEHLQRGQKIYHWLHMASEIIVFELIQEARHESDIHLHERHGDGN